MTKTWRVQATVGDQEAFFFEQALQVAILKSLSKRRLFGTDRQAAFEGHSPFIRLTNPVLSAALDLVE